MAISPQPQPQLLASTSATTSAPRRLIPISHLDDHFYVWSASDVLHLRSHHRIIGILTGSLPLLPQQNAYLGLPLELMPEEVGLLLQRGVAVLVDDAKAHVSPTKAQWEEWEAAKQEDIRRQRQRAHTTSVEQKRRFEEALKSSSAARKNKDKKMTTTAEAMELEDEKAKGVQQKREARQREKLRLQQLEAGEGGGEEETEPKDTAEAEPLAASSSSARPDAAEPAAEEPAVDLSSYNYAHTTHDASTGLPWYTAPSDATSMSPGSTSKLDLTTTKQAIFTHLNTSRSFYLSCGLRFGGDFVAYPGDPFRYHSHYTLTVPQDEEEGFEVGRMIAQGRLGTAVKKVHLIATRRKGAEGEGKAEEEEEEDKLAFYSLTWAGFGT
ncbi:hypothetical protein BCV69DRAFT_281272 [Microstroma glucosiphilum]|uniref:tRNA-intron lyase n=1 Tax=Pseudomicrostroma glucosiphilum TaxID=1684307 RepID=A0A316UAM7_9BASI|nr:hypothetical protein BCV69DRAFT_281272 [Pseudomicrostroma glucosiphilum]PWN22266.1 hypothetical protein BCV69DRAFT_281272 [Pseudomicrostroma glucosiphilum]